MAIQFLNITGVNTFLTQLKSMFATKDAVTKVKTDTDIYILNIDYENTLAFDTKEIISEEDA